MTGVAVLAESHGEGPAAAVLLAAPGIGTRAGGELVARFGSPSAALAAAVRGGPAVPGDSGVIAAWLASDGAAAVAATAARRRTAAWYPGAAPWPVRDGPPDGPLLLLAEGELDPDAPRVAIVGTRSATPPGLADARELAATLAQAGVVVVSGLAIGIDGAAHEGALAGGGATVAVVATGLDVVYPRRHDRLFTAVRDRGAVVTEAPFGTRAEPWRFPVRNRVIAALADVVVVVEATVRGGARITADHALAYGRPVLAVPGSRRNPAAAGCNALIADGAHPLLDADDVFVALGLAGAPAAPPPPRLTDADERAVWSALHGEPATVDDLCARTGRELVAVVAAVRRLEAAGRAVRQHGLVWPM